MGYSRIAGDPRAGGAMTFTREEWDSYPFAGEKKLKWFRDAKLGLFFHVGLSALGKVDISWSRHTHAFPDPGTGFVPDDVYDGWAKEISFGGFDADEWIGFAARSGFKYVVIIAKHHDGFHMWDTGFSDYKITNAPMGRDYLKELTDACHRMNMPVGIYYSQRDWHHPDYEPVDREKSVPLPDPPFFSMKDGAPPSSGKDHRKYIEYMRATVTELMKNYGRIDILWWDAWWCGGMYEAWMWDADSIEREVRSLQPDIIINNRAGLPGDFDTPEGWVGLVNRERAWETCMPMGDGWAWTGKGVKPLRTILHQFIQTVCGDGNYLLSIGCDSDGRIPPDESERMSGLGKWLDRYGETVYGTRSGPWNPGEYGGSVYKGDTVWVHILNRPRDGILRLPLREYRITEAECLTGEKTEISAEGGTLGIKVPESDYDDIIIRLKMSGDVQVTAGGIGVTQ